MPSIQPEPRVWGRLANGLIAATFAIAMATASHAGEQSQVGVYDVNAGHGLTFVPGDDSIAPAPLAMRGYDPVSYFEGGEPQIGQAALGAPHEGAIYWFASADNRARFVADPARYAPQYGGFCAFGVTQVTKFDGDPLLWNIENGKLYLNVTPDLQAMWLDDLDDNIAAADGIWPDIKDQRPQPLFEAWYAKQ